METKGENFIKVRPLHIDDFSNVLKWSKDDIFCLANGWEKNRNTEELYQWWLHCINNQSEDFVRMGIEINKKIVGYVDLASIKDNIAEIGIAIGESKLWGQGIGFYATKCMMDFASKKLDITIFDAETHKANIRSRKMLEKIGFKEISRIGNDAYQDTKNKKMKNPFFN
ncbi:GNAT family N-acetyltransferase [Bacillus sp. JJ1609]|uniref:GNAT family N-acetyltransferase n=1 Tax=Bacillus sp. JJ1609 TaxID=3122977 RepID=UPI002FFDFEBD